MLSEMVEIWILASMAGGIQLLTRQSWAHGFIFRRIWAADGIARDRLRVQQFWVNYSILWKYEVWDVKNLTF